MITPKLSLKYFLFALVLASNLNLTCASTHRSRQKKDPRGWTTAHKLCFLAIALEVVAIVEIKLNYDCTKKTKGLESTNTSSTKASETIITEPVSYAHKPWEKASPELLAKLAASRKSRKLELAARDQEACNRTVLPVQRPNFRLRAHRL